MLLQGRQRVAIFGHKNVGHHMRMWHTPCVASINKSLDTLRAILSKLAAVVEHLALEKQCVMAIVADPNAGLRRIDGDVGCLIDGNALPVSELGVSNWNAEEIGGEPWYDPAAAQFDQNCEQLVRNSVLIASREDILMLLNEGAPRFANGLLDDDDQSGVPWRIRIVLARWPSQAGECHSGDVPMWPASCCKFEFSDASD